jgi:large subunit ribosomal protein L13e
MGMTRRYSSKVRIGRGFSLAELKAAGLTGAFAQTVGIAVDHRRHNKNADTMAKNVEKLNQYKKALILFPRKDGKHAKGQINDSTADKLNNVEQNVTPALFNLPAVSKTSPNEAITKDMLATKAYQKLRIERTNKRYDGKRKLAAKKAEEAKQ